MDEEDPRLLDVSKKILDAFKFDYESEENFRQLEGELLT